MKYLGKFLFIFILLVSLVVFAGSVTSRTTADLAGDRILTNEIEPYKGPEPTVLETTTIVEETTTVPTTIYVPETTVVPTTVYVAPTTTVYVEPEVQEPVSYGGLDAFLACVRAHESDTAGGYTAVNPSSGAGGAYQFLQSTWNNVANYAGRFDLVGIHPSQASPADQDMMAITLYNWQGASPWAGSGCY
jgi:hypothetical protein